MGVVGFVLKQHQLSNIISLKKAVALASIANLQTVRGVTLKAAVGELQDVQTVAAPNRSRRAYLEAWRHKERDMSVALSDIEAEVVDRLVTTLVGLSRQRTWSDHGLNIAVGQRLGTETSILQSRIDALRIAIVARVQSSIKMHTQTRETGNVDVDDGNQQAGENGDNTKNEMAHDGADALELDAPAPTKSVSPRATAHKPGSSGKVDTLAARYAAGESFWEEEDTDSHTSPEEEEKERQRRIAESLKAAARFRDDVRAHAES
jgi:hypothetical protein